MATRTTIRCGAKEDGEADREGGRRPERPACCRHAQALGNPARLHVAYLLGCGERTVTDIRRLVSQAVTSQHSALRLHDLLQVRDGSFLLLDALPVVGDSSGAARC